MGLEHHIVNWLMVMVHHYGLGASPDPQTNELLNKIEQILFPVIYAVAGFALILVGVRYGFKIHGDPENKGEHIKHMIWAIGGILLVFIATGIGHIILAKYLGLI